MNGYNVLELTLRDILKEINPSRDDWNHRFDILKEIRVLVEGIESLRGATVEPYGSFVSDLFTRWGDLDISIELANGSYIALPGRKQKQSLLGDVMEDMMEIGGFHRLKFLSDARVPILKFEAKNNISCDVSINNLLGQMKSKLLFWINVIDGRFRDLVLLVKEWAKAHRINDSKGGTLNSYSLSLLVVFHLQNTAPAILPPLQEIYPKNLADDLQGLRLAVEKHIEDICSVNIHKITSDKSRLINRSSVPQLFVSFLAKFSDICAKASTHGISPFRGNSEEILSNTRWLPKTYALYVEDPFEQPENTARSVGANQLTKIAKAIRVTYRTLVSQKQDRLSLLHVLVGPQTARLMIKPLAPSQLASSSSSSSSSSSRMHNHNNNPRRNNGKAPIDRNQTRPKSPKQAVKKAPATVPQNGVANGPPIGVPVNQTKQVWRPKANKTEAGKSIPSHPEEEGME